MVGGKEGPDAVDEGKGGKSEIQKRRNVSSLQG